jgi:Ni/Co efflux regulator RcnB
MKRLAIVTAAATLFLGTAAFAAPHHQGTDGRYQRAQHTQHQRYDQARRADHDRRDTYRYRYNERTAHTWRYGRSVDWRARRLRRPPVGYHWVRAGDGFLLVRIANGFVLDVAFAR